MTASLVETAYPLSPLQHGLLFHSVVDAADDPYLRQDRYVLEGVLETGALSAAWRTAAAAHPMLRTAIVWQDLDTPLQVVARTATVDVDFVDLTNVEPSGRAAHLDALAARDLSLGFDLARPPLVRVSLARVAPVEHAMIVTFHHIILDGWSLPLVVGDVFLAYAHHVGGVEPALPTRRPFKDFIAWLGSYPLDDAYRHWQRRLEGVRAPTPLPGRRVATGTERYDQFALELDRDETRRLVEFTRRERVTLATQLHGAWALVLGASTGLDDVVFGTTVSGRPDALDGVEEIAGMFINTLPVRAALPRSAPTAEWLRELQTALAEDRNHGYVQLGEIARSTKLAAETRLIESLVVFENAPSIIPPELERYRDVLRVTLLRGADRSSVPLVLVGLPGDHLRLELHLDADQVDTGVAATLLERVRDVLLNVAVRPQVNLGELLAPSTGTTPTPEAVRERAPAPHVEPRGEVERLLAAAFGRTLGLDRVGIHDDFFDLGGDSLLSLRLVARARAAGLVLELRDVLQLRTVAELAPFCRAVDDVDDVGDDSPDDDVPLSPMQLRYLERAGRDAALFDQVEGLVFDIELAPHAVETALRAVGARHAALRTRLWREKGIWRQRVLTADEETLTFSAVDLSSLNREEAERAAAQLANELRSTRDLATRPPWSALLLLLPDRESHVVVAVNHLVFDPYSWSVLLTDFARALFLGGDAIASLKPPPFSVWTRHLHSLVGSTTEDEGARFWLRALDGADAFCPADLDHGANDIGSSAGIEIRLTEQETEQLLSNAAGGSDGARVDAVLMAALARAYVRWAATSGLYVFVESSGRDIAPPGTDMSSTVGWFTCLSPAWIPVGDDEPHAATIAQVKQTLGRLRPYRHTWDLMRAASDGLAALPEPKIALNYLGQADREQHQPPAGVSIKPLYGPTADWNVLEGRIDPTLERDVLLDVEAVVVEGRLSAHFIYSTNRHRPASVVALAEAFRSELLAACPELETVA